MTFFLFRRGGNRLRRRGSMRKFFVVVSLDKQIQNEKELIRLASAGMGGATGGLFCILFSQQDLLSSTEGRPSRTRNPSR